MKVYRINKGSWGKVRAFFDLQTKDGFIIKGLRMVEGINGKFVAMPSQKSQDGEFYDTVLADKELKDKILILALEAYDKGVAENIEEQSFDDILDNSL
tara:strand:+ start:106 stop:399 length:294 start_codon:yes stop_codon:yes gene_type:complete